MPLILVIGSQRQVSSVCLKPFRATNGFRRKVCVIARKLQPLRRRWMNDSCPSLIQKRSEAGQSILRSWRCLRSYRTGLKHTSWLNIFKRSNKPLSVCQNLSISHSRYQETKAVLPGEALDTEPQQVSSKHCV